MAFVTKRTVFFHVPKTAGQWVAQALGRSALLLDTVGPVHATPDEVEDDPRVTSRPVSFAFVRHPLNWYQSMWAHRMDENWGPIDDPDWFTPEWVSRWAHFTEVCRAKDFETFVEACLSEFSDGWVTALFDAYTRRCTHTGRQERATEDLIRILTEAVEEFDETAIRTTPVRNVRGGADWRRHCRYSPGLARRVVAVEHRVIETYGYEPLPEHISVVA